MKIIYFFMGFLLITGCAHVSTTSTPVNINGTWKGEYESGVSRQPPMVVVFNFISDGESLTGKVCNVTTSPGLWTPLENGKIDGNTVSFTTSPTSKKGLRELRIYYKGMIEGDEIKLTIKAKAAGEQDNQVVGGGRRAMGEIDSQQKTIGSMKGMMGGMFDISGTEAASVSSSSQKIIIRREK